MEEWTFPDLLALEETVNDTGYIVQELDRRRTKSIYLLVDIEGRPGVSSVLDGSNLYFGNFVSAHVCSDFAAAANEPASKRGAALGNLYWNTKIKVDDILEGRFGPETGRYWEWVKQYGANAKDILPWKNQEQLPQKIIQDLASKFKRPTLEEWEQAHWFVGWAMEMDSLAEASKLKKLHQQFTEEYGVRALVLFDFWLLSRKREESKGKKELVPPVEVQSLNSERASFFQMIRSVIGIKEEK